MADKIPLATWRKIFLRLPAESLFRLRCVCKRWRKVIDKPRFIKAHTNNHLSSNTILIRHKTGHPFYPLYSINLETLNFTNGPQTITVTPLKLTRTGLSQLESFPVSSCNGLILVTPEDRDPRLRVDRDHEGRPWEIWNPLTHERLKLPILNIRSNDIMGYGLGYDSAADDYKVVVMINYTHGRGHGKFVRQVHVYSLKSDSWSRIGNCPFKFEKARGVFAFLNGAFHWINSNDIVAFDLATESYRQLPMGAWYNGRMKSKLTFCVRDYDGNDYNYVHSSHDSCYSLDSNWYDSCSEDGQ